MSLGILTSIHTNTVDFELNLGAQDLVPFVDGVDQIAAAFERAGATERVRERGIGGEVGIDSFGLGRERCKSLELRNYHLFDVVPVQQASPGRACVQRR